MEESVSGRGFVSLEECAQEYIELFWLLQQEKEAAALFRERAQRQRERERSTEIFLPAVRLRERFALTDTEYWAVMFAFCCELEGGLCVDCRNRLRENWPSLQYTLQLLSKALPVDFADVAGFCGSNSPMAGLMDWRLGEAWEEERGILQRPALLKPAVFHFLLTGGLLQEDWYEFFAAGREEGLPEEGELLPLHEKEYGKLCGLLERRERLGILLCGSRGSGSHTLVRRACRRVHADCLFVRTAQLCRGPMSRQLCIRQTLQFIAGLLEPVIVMEPGEEAQEPFPAAEAVRIWKREEAFRYSPVCFLAQTRSQEELVKAYADVRLCLPEALTREEKRKALELWVDKEERRPWQEGLLEPYHLNIGELKRRQEAVSLLAGIKGSTLEDRRVWMEGLKGDQEASAFGRIIRDSCEPEEMILPEDCRRQLDTVIRLARAWRGEKGLQLLFHGNSGTGKTMAASMLAGQLHLPLFKVNLSQVFDKYIGETEKHIDEIFRLAGRNHYLLFFDEADSLFARRTAVRDSHDRYANVSAAFLLQRMEEYDGILILATNLKDHFDDAFVRRIRFAVKFRNLDREGRQRLWEKELEGGLPLGEDVDTGALADAVQLSPARISAAARVAKLLAACDGCGAVTVSHLREALEMEASKDETAIKRF